VRSHWGFTVGFYIFGLHLVCYAEYLFLNRAFYSWNIYSFECHFRHVKTLWGNLILISFLLYKQAHINFPRDAFNSTLLYMLHVFFG